MRKTFKVDARTLLHLGRNSIRDSTTAVLELVKNSYDAGSTIVNIIICTLGENRYIRIIDDGQGMSIQDIENYWLHIGYSHKRGMATNPAGRQPAGEKGIGRLSADRLGAHLELVTKQQNGDPHGLFMDWDAFDVDGREISDIEVEELVEPRLPDFVEDAEPTAEQGTSLTIRCLRQPWTEEDIAILKEELALLVSPFKGQDGFRIHLESDIAPHLNSWIDSPLFDRAVIDLDGTFDGEALTYKLITRPQVADMPGEERHEANLVIPRGQLYNIPLEQPLFDPSPMSRTLGSFRIVLKFYLRSSEVAQGLGVKLGQLKTFLDNNTGVRIYRDGLRVKPYGNPNDPGGDWLNLADRKNRNPAGPGRSSFRIGPNQLVGAVMITKAGNIGLVDTSGREGIVESEALRELRACILGCVRLVEGAYHKVHRTEPASPIPRYSPVEAARALSRELTTFSKDLTQLSGNLKTVHEVPAATRLLVDRAVEASEGTAQKLGDAVPVLNDLILQATTFRGLATIGIAASTFGHETQTSLNLVSASSKEVVDSLNDTPPDVNGAIKEAAKVHKNAGIIGAWGKFALSRVRRDKRRRRHVNVVTTIDDVVGSLEPTLREYDIALNVITQPMTLHTFEMDIESVFVNLLTNAVTACLQKPNERRIRVEVRPGMQGTPPRLGMCLTVADSGPGIAPQHREQIWEPLYTTKEEKVNGKTEVIGTGIGLYVIRSILDDTFGEATVTQDDELQGARFDIWMPGG